MSEHAQLVAVAAAAAAALVAEMAKDGWSSMRTAVARFFGHAGEAEAERQLARLDSDQAQAQTLDPALLEERWQRRFMTLVEDFPDAAGDLAVLAARREEVSKAGVNQNATGNTGPTIQVGRDNFGGLNTEGRR
ncbi:hypothetical protein [Streptomyces sp. NPDC017949]|uniref:hypothetical protein n=1 Tax=Streptomyces sp. NPDC017949 TaxID=3365020 RepID=UPI0037B542EE